MKKLLHIVLSFMFCMVLSPVFANDDNEDLNTDEESDTVTKDEAPDKESILRDRKKGKKKKGERNVKVQPDKEDDENIILELDRT